MKRLVLPRIGAAEDVRVYLNRLALAVEQQATRAPAGRAYTVTNAVAARDLDTTTATTGDVAEVLGTLIADLQAGGSIA